MRRERVRKSRKHFNSGSLEPGFLDSWSDRTHALIDWYFKMFSILSTSFRIIISKSSKCMFSLQVALSHCFETRCCGFKFQALTLKLIFSVKVTVVQHRYGNLAKLSYINTVKVFLLEIHPKRFCLPCFLPKCYSPLSLRGLMQSQNTSVSLLFLIFFKVEVLYKWIFEE